MNDEGVGEDSSILFYSRSLQDDGIYMLIRRAHITDTRQKKGGGGIAMIANE